LKRGFPETVAVDETAEKVLKEFKQGEIKYWFKLD
jgi:hypothetical protein